MTQAEKDLHLDSVTVDLSGFLAVCGQDLPQPEQNNYEVNRDCIRRICYAIEDFNALYLDDEFARQTRWGGIIAPPGYLFSHGRQFFHWTARVGPEIVDSEGRVYAGGDNAGGEWEFYLPARSGDTIISNCTPVGAHVKRGRRSGIFVVATSECRFVNQRGELVAKYRDHFFRFSNEIQRGIGAQAAAYPPLPPGQMTRSSTGIGHRFYFPADRAPAPLPTKGGSAARRTISTIPRRYDRHNVYFEDVQEGTDIAEYVIGPLDSGHLRRWEMHTIDMLRPEFKQGNPLFEEGVVPDFYAAGAMRTAWLGTMLTKWAGPNVWIRKLSYLNREWALVGFKYFCRGQVTRKFIAEDGSHCVECRLKVENELGIVTNVGYAEVQLLSHQQ